MMNKINKEYINKSKYMYVQGTPNEDFIPK